MARIKLVNQDDMTSKQKAEYDRFPSNLFCGLLKTKNSTHGYAELGAALCDTYLSAQDREFVILRVAYMSKSEYELMQHRHLAMQQGWSAADIDAIARNNYQYFDQRMAVILKFIDESVSQVKVSKDTFEATKKYLSEGELAELTLLIGHYMMTARFLETLEIDLDKTPTSWGNVYLFLESASVRQ
ncbi:carboxymuconolactone decarboxylase family protein [Sporomusa acidovorans]|uniref:Carboxymuconolactone decarboxylase-like domain-containing protein n=1 Tax=Sporomusa acidovorans (strain ATCC 49682 / DSM 3132 / Mol) TaxID=1123286 RepID=A0ABZ3IX36_SPOA4|nr:carboxymuconolactone decarboxylase family protein [Sporomusa acidovorans]OZC13035.1 hypothetical protein SPACI_58490 [Sporomusa acidovorans DSM 3132]SDF51513.1 Carboxymuconolactone decarboxylase family protein [Sporomusa acidovorans]